jgi:hypothetical protein
VIKKEKKELKMKGETMKELKNFLKKFGDKISINSDVVFIDITNVDEDNLEEEYPHIFEEGKDYSDLDGVEFFNFEETCLRFFNDNGDVPNGNCVLVQKGEMYEGELLDFDENSIVNGISIDILDNEMSDGEDVGEQIEEFLRENEDYFYCYQTGDGKIHIYSLIDNII